MRPVLKEKTIVLGSRNKEKRQQLINALAPFHLDFIMAEDTDVADPEETGTTFLENALIKARAYAEGTHLPALSDDSGLVIPALAGAPGIYSARFAAQHGGYDGAFQVLEQQLKGLDPRAYLTSTVVLMWPDGTHISGTGETWGDLVFPPRPGLGFGYYPIFRPEGETRTVSEMSSSDEGCLSSISHRQKSMDTLMAQCVVSP